jgi:hypothetical protein
MISKAILVVIVLYKKHPLQSETISSLKRAVTHSPGLLDRLDIILWDNSPYAMDQRSLPIACDYVFAGNNAGTSGAYNHAMEVAESRGIPWLLLLDQDTTISEEFLVRMLAYGNELKERPDVGSVVPFIRSHGSLVSPRFMDSFHRLPQIPPAFSGICKRKAYGINSGSLMRVASLREIGGYSRDFWLDLSDIYVFRAMYCNGSHLYVAGDLVLEHSVTNMNFDNDMAPARYLNFLAAEGAYVDLYSSSLERAFHLVRLLARVMRQRRRYKNRVFSKMTWDHFCRRLFDSRTQRMTSWRHQLLQRDIPAMENGKAMG